MTDLAIRDIKESDIPLIMDYWFNPKNQEYHSRRGSFGEAQRAALANDAELLLAQTKTPLMSRRSTTAIVEYRGRAIGHVLLNDIHSNEKRRMHFHAWPNTARIQNLGSVLTFLPKIVLVALDYFFQSYDIEYIIGDISAGNEPANYVLARMGFLPEETVEATYLGEMGRYSRYKFHRGAFLLSGKS